MKKLTVILVDPPDDEAASVTLRSEQGEVVAFCHPCSLKVGDVIANRLSVLDADVRAAYLSDWPDDEKEALSSEHLERIGHFAYRGRGRVIDSEEGLVAVQGFVIEMGAMNDGHVDFEITRLDISLNPSGP
ncbi:hypothetical protein [Massilia rubra]|uniref:Uncharacterized protein n=1 Tax=Massilia rubra TaxID=2607910 RepID=A0ABX0M0F4_9BURK|nr:hypothetical protein [Massilia rubra]NHZ37817.1 hypothetical protein [Massilia rubra]